MPINVIYARKSTESDDKQVLSIDSQIHELKELALRRGLGVAEVLTEARSAKAPGRPVFGDLMRRVRRGNVASVLCWKMDRLARNHLDHGTVLQALADGQLRQVVTPERTYTADGNDRFLGNFEFGIATKFIDDLRTNVKRGNRARFQQGWPNYRPPTGYAEDHAAKTVVKDAERFDLVRRAWDLLLTATMRPSVILKILNEQWGYRSRKTKERGGGPMSLSGLYGLLANPFYKGIIQLENGDTYKGAHEPMVTEEEFARAQELLGRAGRARPIHHEFTFSGLLRCASCGRALVGEVHAKRSGKRYVYYRCHRSGRAQSCTEPTLPETALVKQLTDELGQMRLSSEAAEWIRDNLAGSINNEASQIGAARDSVAKALQAAQTEDDTLLSLRLRGSVDDDTFERRHAEIADRKVHLQLQLDRPVQTPEALLARLDDVLRFAQHAPGVFKQGTAVQQRQIVEAVGSNFRVTGRKALYEAKRPFSLIRGTTSSSLWCTVAKDVRTWLLNTEDFWLPDLDHLLTEDSVTGIAPAA